MRPVIAPTSVADTFAATIDAFNIAEIYQTPVILLSDADIAQRKEIVEAIDVASIAIAGRRRPTAPELEGYRRFALSESGVSPISEPGMAGGNYLASGIEHNELGEPSAGGENHARMNAKRISKLAPLKGRRDLFEHCGNPFAPIALVSWGSAAGAAREAMQQLLDEGIDVKLLVPRLLFPVAEAIYEDFFASVRLGLVVEHRSRGSSFTCCACS